jgi:WD repeat-containing protein 89
MREAACVAQSALAPVPDSYIYSIAPTDGDIAAISSDDSLRVFAAADIAHAPATLSARCHDGGVTGLETHPDRPHALFTAGRDGRVRCWDTRAAGSVLELRDGMPRSLPPDALLEG